MLKQSKEMMLYDHVIVNYQNIFNNSTHNDNSIKYNNNMSQQDHIYVYMAKS